QYLTCMVAACAICLQHAHPVCTYIRCSSTSLSMLVTRWLIPTLRSADCSFALEPGTETGTAQYWYPLQTGAVVSQRKKWNKSSSLSLLRKPREWASAFQSA